MDNVVNTDIVTGPDESMAVGRLSNSELLKLVVGINDIKHLKQFFNDHEVIPRKQLEVVLLLCERKSDIVYLEALTKYAEKLADLINRNAVTRKMMVPEKSDKPRISVPLGKKMATFCLTDAGKKVPSKEWDFFFEELTVQGLVSSDDERGYRSLLGLRKEPLTEPLVFHGNNQQLMFIFAALYGTLVYRSQVNDTPLVAGKTYTFVPLISTPSGGTVTGNRTTDPYCQTLAAAVLDRHGKPLTPRQLTSAKNMLETTVATGNATTVKSLKPHLVAKLMLILPAQSRRTVGSQSVCKRL